jgi:hypothetical protein
MKDAQPIKRYRIRIASGVEKGRYLGLRFGGGYVSNPDVVKNPPTNVPGYGLWAQEGGATEFFEANTAKVQAELERLGYDTELVQVG